MAGGGAHTLAMALSKLAGLHPVVRDRAVMARDIAQHFGIPVTFTSGYRSCEFQRELRTAWERGQSKWPANRAGFSGHNWGLAWDSTVAPEHQDAWNYIRQWVGFAVLPNDIIHAEVPGWETLVPLGQC